MLSYCSYQSLCVSRELLADSEILKRVFFCFCVHHVAIRDDEELFADIEKASWSATRWSLHRRNFDRECCARPPSFVRSQKQCHHRIGATWIDLVARMCAPFLKIIGCCEGELYFDDLQFSCNLPQACCVFLCYSLHCRNASFLLYVLLLTLFCASSVSSAHGFSFFVHFASCSV